MTYLDKLRAAISCRKERIESNQKGIPTFFDKVALLLLEALDETPPEPGTELKTLSDLVISIEKQRYVRVTEREEYLAGNEALLKMMPLQETMLQGLFAPLTWKGRPLIKSVLDFTIYSELIQAVRPATIIEFGSGSGASAHLLWDLSRTFGLSPQIVSIDIQPVEDPPPRIRFITGDCLQISEVLPVSLIEKLPHPWIVSEDAHVNVRGILQHLRPFLCDGDYIMVEDNGPEKAESIRSFLLENEDSFLIDRMFVDRFGLNATSAKNSVFRFSNGARP